MDMKRLFQQAVQDATSSANRPASGSQGGDAAYGGSRRVKQRFEYDHKSRAAFVELHPSFMPTPEEFKAHLAAVPGVTKVDWQTTKPSQGNVGNHYCQQNLLVYSSTGPGSASPPIEFELTRNQHVKDQRVKPPRRRRHAAVAMGPRDRVRAQEITSDSFSTQDGPDCCYSMDTETEEGLADRI